MRLWHGIKCLFGKHEKIMVIDRLDLSQVALVIPPGTLSGTAEILQSHDECIYCGREFE
jgi:hypothetical protein